MAKPRRIKPVTFPLASSTTRISLFTGLLANPKNLREVVEEALMHDSSPRMHTKPVVAFGQRFDSVNSAARWAYTNQPKFRVVKPGVVSVKDKSAVIGRMARRISRIASADETVGFYWCE